MQFVDLTELEIPTAVIELVPESVARENVVMPLSLEGNTLKIITADPTDFDTIQKLQFILNKDIEPVLAARRSRSSRRSTATTARPKPSRSTRCSSSSPTPPSTSPRPNRIASWPRPTTPTPRSSSWCNLIIQEAVSLRASATSTSSRSPTASASATGSTACWSSATAAPRRLLAPLLSRLKIMGIDRHLREAPPPGRPDQDDRRTASTSTCASASCRRSTASRPSCASWTAATSRSASATSASREDDYMRFQQIIKRPNGIFLVTGPTGSGQDDDALRRAERAEPTRPEDHHGRGPGRVLPARHQPGRGEAQDRARLRPHHPGHAAASPEHHPRRRNPRQGDGRDRHPGLSDRTLGFQYTTHERCAQRYYTPGRYRRAAVPRRIAPSSPSWRSVWCA